MKFGTSLSFNAMKQDPKFIREFAQRLDREGMNYMTIAGHLLSAPGATLTPIPLGTIPAAYALAILPRHIYDLAFAVIVLVGVALSASGVHIARTRLNVLIAGTLSGIAGTVSSIGGPPMAILLQHRSPQQIRSTLGVYFVAGAAMSLVGLGLAVLLPLYRSGAAAMHREATAAAPAEAGAGGSREG